MDQMKEQERSYTPPIKIDEDNDDSHNFHDSLLEQKSDEFAESFGKSKN